MPAVADIHISVCKNILSDGSETFDVAISDKDGAENIRLSCPSAKDAWELSFKLEAALALHALEIVKLD